MSHVRYPENNQTRQQKTSQFTNSAGCVRNINNNFSNNNIGKMKVQRKASIKFVAIVLALVTTATATGLISYELGKNSHKEEINLLPEDCIMINLPLDIGLGEDVTEYAKGFYTENYEGIYPSVENYEEAILKINDINNSSFSYNDTIKIPIIVESNNEYYVHIQGIMDKIRNIEENEYFVDHVVQYGETISQYAGWASGNNNEMHEKMNEIIKANKLSSSDIRPGDEIKIINPQLGTLKIELQNTIQEYLNSLENNKTK